jgi:hypothetical protein
VAQEEYQRYASRIGERLSLRTQNCLTLPPGIVCNGKPNAIDPRKHE